MTKILAKIKYCRYFFILFLFLSQSVSAAVVAPNDPRYPEAWYLKRIKAPAAWQKTTGSRQVIVAVLDSGVQVNHPDLMDNIWRNPDEQFNGLDNDRNGLVGDVYGWDFIDNTSNPGPNFDQEKKFSGFIHGTLVAGLIGAAGNNGTDGVGVNWAVSLMPLRVLDGKGEGRIAEVIKAIDYAISKKADIINMSFTGLNYSEPLNQAIGRANAAGITVVAAAGNDADKPVVNGDPLRQSADGGATPHYPACFGGPNDDLWAVIGVAALDRDNQKTKFSNYGSRCVDLVAPGVGVAGLLIYAPNRAGFENSYGGNWSGTSLSAPLVSGAAALLKSIKPDLPPKEIYELLTSSADNIFAGQDQQFQGQLGAGLLDINKSVEALLAKYPALAPTPGTLGVVGKIIVSSPRSSLIQTFNLEGESEKNFYAYKDKKIGIQAALGQFQISQLRQGFAGQAGFGPVPHRSEASGAGFQNLIAVAPLSDRAGVRFFDLNGKPISADFFPFGKKWSGGVNIALADFDFDGVDEVIAAPATQGNEVRIFKISGSLPSSFGDRPKGLGLVSRFKPFGPRYVGGINLAIGKFDGSGEPRIAAAVAGKGGAQVRFFNGAGELIYPGFFAYERGWRGGVKVAAFDVDGDGVDEVVTAPAGARLPDVNIYSPDGLAKFTFLSGTKATPALALAAARSADRSIILTAASAKEPVIKIWDTNGILLKSFQIKGQNFSRGLNLLYLP